MPVHFLIFLINDDFLLIYDGAVCIFLTLTINFIDVQGVPKEHLRHKSLTL